MINERKSSMESEPSDEALRALVRAHASAPPYASVDWEALALRVAGDAQHELERRQIAAGSRPESASLEKSLTLTRSLQLTDGKRSGRRVSGRVLRRWWEVTAGWVRPAMIAAAVVIGVATSLTVALPNILPSTAVASGDTGVIQRSASEYASDDRDAGDSAMEAAVVGRTTGQQYDLELAPRTRDQIFTEVVNER